jgi:predicted RNase H-like nuclease (RuvC/YqgF family)
MNKNFNQLPGYKVLEQWAIQSLKKDELNMLKIASNKNRTTKFEIDDEDYDHYALESEITKLSKDIKELDQSIDSLLNKIREIKKAKKEFRNN